MHGARDHRMPSEVSPGRSYDAVHLAAAETLRDPDLVVVAGDTALLAAARAAGLATASVP